MCVPLFIDVLKTKYPKQHPFLYSNSLLFLIPPFYMQLASCFAIRVTWCVILLKVTGEDEIN